MQARNAIFSQNRNAVTSSNYPSNSYGVNQNYAASQNYGTNQNKGNSQELKIGSNRLQYENGIFPSSLRNAVHQWREDDWPASIVCRRETLHLSNIEFRLEDYYLIRNKKLSSKNQIKLVEVINYSSFNKELLDKPVQLLPYSQQTTMSDEVFTRERNQQNEASNRANGSTNTGSVGGNNSNTYGGQTNSSSNNIFLCSRTNNAPSIFGNNSSNTGNNRQNTSNYNENRAVTTGNIFNNNSSSNPVSNNIFTRNSSSASNTQTANTNSGNTQTANTISGNNIFTNNSASNNNTSANNLNNNASNANTQNTQGSSNNIFSNGGSNQGNNSSTNNVFQNIANNNNKFTNNSNNYPGNVNNQTNNVQQQYSIDVNTLMQSFQNYVQNSQTYLHHLSAQTSQLNQKQKEEQTIADKKDVWSEMREESQGIHYNTEFHQQEKRFNLMRKREEEEESMVLILRKPKELIQLQRAQKLQQEQFQNISQNHPQNHSRIIKNDTQYRNIPQKVQEINFNKSVRMNNQLPNKSVRLSNQREDFSSMIYSRCDFTVNQTKLRQLKLLFDEPCTCEVTLDIFWQECDQKEPKMQVKMPTRRTFSIEVAHFDLQTEDGRKFFECELKKSPFVKGDAKFIPDRRKVEINHYNALVKVAGRVEQKILNLQRQKKGKSARSLSPTIGYRVQYSKITDSHIQNLTISRNGKGTIVWQQPVPFETLDFKKDSIFFIEDYETGCELPELQGPCIVTFETLPPQIYQVIKSTGILQAKCNLKKMLQKMNKDIQFGDLWENGSWFFRLKKGFDN